jgi:radical SAM protein with 4Fe4S-binding SPASM domain
MSTTGFKFFPETVVWEITFACNMRCLHCGTSAGKRRPDELTTDEALHLIDELTELGCTSITISGGEPLLRDDWRELATRIRQNGLTSYLITNGYAVTPQIVDDFRDLGFKRVGVSVDGMEAIHNHIRRRDDSYTKCLRAIDLMRERDIDFCVISQVSNLNLGELDAMHKLLVDHGCKGWRVQMCTTTGRMMEHANMVLSLDNYERLVDKLLELKAAGDIFIDVGENIGYYGCKGSDLLDGNPYYGCYAGVRVAGIESNGNVKGCLSMPPQFVEGNIREKSFTEIWQNPDGFAYNRKFTRETASGACHDCRYLPLCRGGCATTSVSQSGRRADNPFCMYQIELKQGIQPVDSEDTVALLKRFNPDALKERPTG